MSVDEADVVLVLVSKHYSWIGKQTLDSIHNATASYKLKFVEAIRQNATLQTRDSIGALMEGTNYEMV